jgi:uncharacterized damage-inducible protein DinB
MSARDALLAEFDHEMAMTRQVLERVPDAGFGWRPHVKSFALGGLATHLAQLPHWGTRILERDSYDLAEADRTRALDKTTTSEVLETFDRHVREVRRALLDKSDAELMAPWALKRGDHLLMSLPRLSALRRFLLHHVIHHRGQLTVYLRLQDVPLPPLYGPTADERM